MNYQGSGYIYAIRNRKNAHAYIGSTVNYKSRWHTHRSQLRRGVHHSFVLQKAWDKYGEAAFDFELLLVCPKELRAMYEARLMPLQTYNIMRTPKESGVRGGWKHSDVFKAKMSALHKGKTLSEDHRAKLSAAASDRVYDEAFKQKARSRQIGVSPSVETRQRLSHATTQARKAETERNEATVLRLYEMAKCGSGIGKLCADAGITTTTFYSHCKRLGLPNLKHGKQK
jgi:group I intron endonuclease